VRSAPGLQSGGKRLSRQHRVTTKPPQKGGASLTRRLAVRNEIDTVGLCIHGVLPQRKPRILVRKTGVSLPLAGGKSDILSKKSPPDPPATMSPSKMGDT
jgi:hypothetical protein